MASAGNAEAEPSSVAAPESVVASADAARKPVATPCRAQDPASTRLVPDYVLKALAKETQPVAPFGTVTGEDEVSATMAPQKESKQPKKSKKKVSAKDKAKKKQEVAGPDVEEGLKLEPVQEGNAGEASVDQGYNPKKFAAMRKEFIKTHREKTGASHKDANDEWMRSDVRADLLSTLPEKELKRRRFL